MKTKHMILTLALLSIAAVVACGGDDGADGTPTASTTASTAPTKSPTATQSVEEEVSAAYLEYWDAYSAALLELDASLAEEFASGEELDRIADEIADLQAQGLALRVRMEHNFAVIEATDNSAKIVDDLVNNSFLVDAVTKEPPEAEGSGERIQDTFEFERVDGNWVVVRSTRIQVEG